MPPLFEDEKKNKRDSNVILPINHLVCIASYIMMLLASIRGYSRDAIMLFVVRSAHSELDPHLSSYHGNDLECVCVEWTMNVHARVCLPEIDVFVFSTVRQWKVLAISIACS
ncbi:unnamed protein product [Ixodes pacificus]